VRRYFGRKLLIYALTFYVAATIDWLITRFMPGNPVQSLLSRHQVAPEAVPDLIAYYNALFGLDVPLWQQYLNFWGSLFQGDLGRSVYLSGRPVVDVIMAALPYTLALLVPAILLSWWTGNKFGAMAARRKVLDNAILPIGYILSATPYMWLAIMVAWIFGSVLGMFPISGGYSYAMEPSWSWAFFGSLLSHWVMPFMSLFLVMFGGWAIGMRNMIIYELEADYSKYLDALGAPRGLIRAMPSATRCSRRSRASRSRWA
jgi:peptide/nickel transport system permease protein